MTKKKTPELINDKDLDQASGGLSGLLLPAVQKVREAAASQSSPTVSEIVVTKTVDTTSP